MLPPPVERWYGRNHEWFHLNNAEIISMQDKREYAWYAAWDLAFHCDVPNATFTRPAKSLSTSFGTKANATGLIVPGGPA